MTSKLDKRGMSGVPMLAHPDLYFGLDKQSAGAAITMAVFHGIGGVKAMTEWAEDNPDAFYTKLFPKIITTPKQVEITTIAKVEDMVRILDLEEGTGYVHANSSRQPMSGDDWAEKIEPDILTQPGIEYDDFDTDDLGLDFNDRYLSEND